MTFEWLKRGATVDDLQKQLEAARDAHQESLDLVAKAQAAFDDDPRKHKNLLDAQDSERAARAFLERAERMLADARAKVQADERAKLERRAAELREQLSNQGLLKLRAPTRDAEIEALKTAIEARANRVAVEEQISKLSHELQQVRMRLGEPDEGLGALMNPLYHLPMPSTLGIGDELLNAFRDLGSDNLRMRCVAAMRQYLGALR